MIATPNRASDSGPDDSGEPKDFRDWLMDARDDAEEAYSYRLERDDRAEELKLRRAAIARAKDALANADALLAKEQGSAKAERVQVRPCPSFCLGQL